MKRQKTILFLGICLSTALGFCGCSSDNDEANDPQVEITISEKIEIVPYRPHGSYPIYVEIKGTTETPKPEDFTFVSENSSAEVLHHRWDTTEPGKSGNQGDVTFSVTKILPNEYNPGGYTLTITYDVSGCMTATRDKTHIVYKKKAQTAASFLFSYQGYAQQAVDLEEFYLIPSETPSTVKIDVQAGYDALGISPNEVHGVEGRHCIYSDGYGHEVDLNSEFCVKGNNDITFSADYEGGKPVITIYGADKLKERTVYYVHFIVSLGQNRYAAMNVPIFTMEEE